MSENIPESIPTSADPRSKRPLKKRAINTPASAQAASLDALFAKPSQDIRIPSSADPSKSHTHGQPPEIVANVQGSSAGAGSGEFHVYKASRRREYERLRAMDEELQEEEEGERWAREKRKREERDAEKTRKNREKRERAKKKGTKGGVEGKVGGLKARVDDNGNEETNATEGVDAGSGAAAQKEIGLIIHDDD
ncbi:hypothetical protein BJ878DRAFT_123433 [Calycina marina]|uniref:DUF1168-domain-containing protein n=1 Tax=Calycina marina TaxID=1763456 RepID=A0A9P8CI17_9HELO|nr:hypothetical protein BJ878DRAFT_123433 [Calycina marina]